MTDKKFHREDRVNWGGSRIKCFGTVIDSKFEDGEWMYEVSPDSGQSGWFSEKELTEA